MIMNFKRLHFYVMAFVFCGLVLPFVSMHAAGGENTSSALVHHDAVRDGSLALNKEAIKELKWLQGYLRQKFFETGYERPALEKEIRNLLCFAYVLLPSLYIAFMDCYTQGCVSEGKRDIIPYFAVSLALSLCYYLIFLKDRHIPTLNLILTSVSPVTLMMYDDLDERCHGIGAQFLKLLGEFNPEVHLKNVPEELLVKLETAHKKYKGCRGDDLRALRQELNQLGYEIVKDIEQKLSVA